MALNFTIRNFIENRWAEAKEELAWRDQAYVAAVQSYVPLYNKLILPDSIHPQRRLLYVGPRLLISKATFYEGIIFQGFLIVLLLQLIP